MSKNLMPEKTSAANYLPKRFTLSALKKNAKTCHGCHLYKYASQTVFGVGPKETSLMIVGEIPGQKEDETSIPFTGPAGTYLRNVMGEVGLDEQQVYFTNVVKHFKFSYMNKKKLHRSPAAGEINACRPWLDAEIQVIQPQLILALGAVAAKAIINNTIKIREQRGKFFDIADSRKALVTFHPSALLRATDEADRRIMKNQFQQDIRKAATFIKKLARSK